MFGVFARNELFGLFEPFGLFDCPSIFENFIVGCLLAVSAPKRLSFEPVENQKVLCHISILNNTIFQPSKMKSHEIQSNDVAQISNMKPFKPFFGLIKI